MIYRFIFFVLIISLYEIVQIKKNGNKRELYVFIGFMGIAASVGIYYFSHENGQSIAEVFLNFINVKW